MARDFRMVEAWVAETAVCVGADRAVAGVALGACTAMNSGSFVVALGILAAIVGLGIVTWKDLGAVDTICECVPGVARTLVGVGSSV